MPTLIYIKCFTASVPTEANSRGGGEGGRVPNLCMAVVVRPQTLASLLRRDGARRVFTNQADPRRQLALVLEFDSHRGEI